MKTTAEFLAAVKTRYNLPSDYALAPVIGISRASISRLTRGKDYMSDETAIKVAELLEIDPSIVFASVHAERAARAHKPAEAKVWERIAIQMMAVAAALAVLAVLPFGLDNLSGGMDRLSSPALLVGFVAPRSMYIMSNAINTYWQVPLP